METVNFLNRMDLQIWDAELGTGTINVVFNAPKDGSLELMAFVFPWMTYAHHLMQMEFVQLVTKDTLWSMEIVSYHNKQGPLIWDAEHGTGTINVVFNALKDGCSDPTVFVYLWAIFVLPSERTESALLAIKVINWSTETVSFLNKQGPQIWVAELGTGITKDALNALKDGCSDPTVFVFLLTTTVPLSTPMVFVHLATKDINLLTEIVNFLNKQDL